MILRHVTMSLDASPPARTTRWTGSSNTASRSRDTVRRRHVLALLAPALLAPAGGYPVTSVALYLARYGVLLSWELTDLAAQLAGHAVDLTLLREQLCGKASD